MLGEACKNCRFWRGREIKDPQGDDTIWKHCYRLPPSPVASAISSLVEYVAQIGFKVVDRQEGSIESEGWADHHTIFSQISDWPITQEDQWCGEWSHVPEIRTIS